MNALSHFAKDVCFHPSSVVAANIHIIKSFVVNTVLNVMGVMERYAMLANIALANVLVATKNLTQLIETFMVQKNVVVAVKMFAKIALQYAKALVALQNVVIHVIQELNVLCVNGIFAAVAHQNVLVVN